VITYYQCFLCSVLSTIVCLYVLFLLSNCIFCLSKYVIWLPIWYLSTFIVFLYCLTHRFAFLYLLTICFNNVLVQAAFIKLKYYECLLCLSQSRTCLLFVCLESVGQIRFFVLLILVELLTITVQINVTEHRRGHRKWRMQINWQLTT
jgi:prepilin signal peptidase PulO-like enzyme (type II secretory pathway)